MWVGGELGELARRLPADVDRLGSLGSSIALTVLYDGEGARAIAAPLLRSLRVDRSLRLPVASNRPQLLYDRAVSSSASLVFAFAWPGATTGRDELLALVAELESAGAEIAYAGDAGAVPGDIGHPLHHGWLQLLDAVPMHRAVVARAALARYEPFDPSPVLRRTFWWDFLRRWSRQGGELRHVPLAPSPAVPWARFPFGGIEETSAVLAQRAIAHGEPADGGSRWSRLAADLPDAERNAVWAAQQSVGAGVAASGSSPRRRSPWPIRMTVLSGLLDSHHNQLLLFTACEHLRGSGHLTWRTLTYDAWTSRDLDDCDLLVMSRPRYDQVPDILDAGDAAHVPVLVLSDDNWLAAARDFPDRAAMFASGSPAIEAYLAAVRRAAAVLVFNDRLAGELAPLTRRVLQLPATVDPAAFRAAPSPARRRELLLGYGGSPRLEAAGFAGLARFLEQRQDTRLLFMGHAVPPQLENVAGERIRFVPWRHDYFAYARRLAGERPDVLLAPLGSSVFEASKIATKYLETSMVGAAGVYSRTPPYTDVVRDGETGLLVDNEPSAWLAALERLAEDRELRNRIAAASRRDVEARFTTERVLPSFLAVLSEVTGR